MRQKRGLKHFILLGLLCTPLITMASKLPTTTVPKVAALQSNIGTEYPETYLGPLSYDQKWVVEAYQRVYPQMSLAQADLAVRETDKVNALVNAVASRENATFAGSFYDPPTNTQVIYVTSAAAKASVDRQAMQRGVNHRVEIKPYSMAELRPIAQAFNRSLPENERQDYVAVANIKLNRVEVTATDASKLNRAKLLLNDPRVVFTINTNVATPAHDQCTGRSHCLRPLRAGITIGTWNGSGSGTNCTAGFTARSSDSTNWQLSAAHCVSAPVITTCITNNPACIGHWRNYIGPVREKIYYSGVDVLRARIDNSYWRGHDFGYMYSNSAGYDDTVDVDYTAINYWDIQDGGGVCFVGQHNETPPVVNPCGVMNGWSSAGYRKVDGYVICPGDSGGGVYQPQARGRVAFGIIEGYSGPCHGSGYSVYTDITMYYEEFNYLNYPATIRVHTR